MKCSDEMTTHIYRAIEASLGAIREVHPFTNGDVMSAALHVLIDTGMRAVEKGTCTREELIEDICAAVPGAVKEWKSGEEEVRGLLQ